MRGPFQRVVLIVLDGVGIGALPDADEYGDASANTLLHVAEACGGLELPALRRLGLGNLLKLPGVDPVSRPAACWGRMAEVSAGKDSTTGHWELAGLIQRQPFPTYPHGFPDEIIAAFTRICGVRPLGNVAASGTEIIRRLGEEHLHSGRPIVYTSVDSVFQVAAHEEVIPLDELYRICRAARDLLDPYRIGRVIARPFVGTSSADFRRTKSRHDFSLPPPEPTLLDRLVAAGIPVTGVGKVADLFAGRGLTNSLPSQSNRQGMELTRQAFAAISRGLVFSNLVDFDMEFGHRLDPGGFGAALVEFDAWLEGFVRSLGQGDLLIITADHGCDPTTPGTDHCREYVPLLAWSPQMRRPTGLGTRRSFSDVAETLAANFDVPAFSGESFLKSLI